MAFVLTGQINLRPPNNIDSIKKQIENKFRNLSVMPLNNIPTVTGQVKKLNTEITKTVFISKQIDSSFASVGNNLGKTVRRFGAFTVATTALFGIIRSFEANIKNAVLFEKELLKISQVTGTSVKGLSSLKNEITNLSTGLGVGSTKLLSVARVLAQAGLAANDVRVSLEAIAKSDLAPTFDSVEQTTEGVVAVMRQFKKEAKDVEAVLGSINAVAGKFAVESADLIQFIRGAGGTFEAAGGSVEELFGLGTSIRATTRESAASIATGLRTIFARLQRTRTQNFLEDFNIQLRLTREEATKLGRTEGEFVGPFEAIKRLSIALQQIPSTDPRFAQIIEELGGFRQINKVIPLIKQNALAQQAYNVALQGTNSLNKDAEKALDSLSNKLDRLSEKFIEISRILLENEGVKQLINQVLTLSNVILDSLKSLSDFANVLAFLPVTSLLGARPFITGFQGLAKNYIERNSGGSVPGTGNKDTIPAMLTPGEFVLKKQAVASIGLSRLMAMNATGKIPGFNKGGLVGSSSFDTIQQVQLGGGVFALANIIGTVNKDFTVLQNSVQTASTTFVALSLVSAALKKDYTSSIDEIKESISKAKSEIKTLASLDEVSGRKSVSDISGKTHYVTSEAMSEIDRFKIANSMQEKLIEGMKKEGDIQNELLTRKKDAIKLAEEERDAIKNIIAFREAQTGKLFKSESVDRVRKKLDAALPTVDLSLLNNKATAASAKSLLGVDPNVISRAVSKTVDEGLLGNLLGNANFTSLEKSFGGAFSAPQFKQRNTDQVLRDFASGQLSGKKASEIFSGTQFSTTFNKLVKTLGVDEARNTVSRSLDRRKDALLSNESNVRSALSAFASGGSGKSAISALAGSDAQKSLRSLIRGSGVDDARKIINQYLSTESTIASSEDLQNIFSSLEGKTAEEQKKFLNNLGSFIRTTELTPEKAIINKAGNIITQDQAQELRDRPFFERTKDKTKFLTAEEKILVDQNKKRKKTLEYISTEEGSKAEEKKIDEKRKEVKKRIAERENYILTLTNQQSALNNEILKLQTKQRDAAAAGDTKTANTLQSRINKMTASGTVTQGRINTLTSEQDQDFKTVSQLNKNQDTVKEVFARAKLIEENSIENQVIARKKAIEEEERNIVAMQRAQNALNNLSIGINVVSAGLIAFGQYLDKEAKSRLESFRKGFGSSEGLASQSATASATGAFGTGAAIGSQLGGALGSALIPVLGPLGPLLGVAAGATIGGTANAAVSFATTFSEVENEIESILRNRTIDRFEKSLINASQNSSLALSDRNFVNRGSSIALQDILTLQGDTNREDLFGRLENLRNPLQEFINRVSTSVKSIDDFNKVVGQDTIELFLILNSIPIEKFNEEIQKNISISNKSRQINEALIKSNQELIYRINLQRNLVSVVSDSIFSLDKGFNSLNSTISGIDGNFRSNLNLTGVDRLSKINNIIDFSSFQLDVTKLGNIFGESGLLISKNSIAAANAIKVLPNVLLDINSRSNLEGIGEFTQKLDSQLSSLGVAEEIRKIIISQVDSIIGPEAKDQNIIEKLNSDFEGTVSQITKGISSLSDPLREAGSLFETKFNEIGDLLDQRINIESKIQQSFLKTIDIYEQSERILASTFNRDVNLQKLLGFENQTQRFILAGNSGLANDPSGIFDRLQTVQEDLREAQYRLSNSTSLTAEEMLSLRDQISVNKFEVSSLTGALEFMADVTKRTSILQESLNKQQRDRETKFGFAETLAFGSQKEIRQLLSTIQLTNKAIGAGSLEDFSTEQKKEIQGLLSKVGDTALFAGGLTGNKARDLLVGNNLRRLGADPDGIIGPGQEEKNIQNQISEAVLRSQEAQEALYLNLQDQNQTFNTELRDTLNIFISDLSNTLSRTTTQNLQVDLARKEVERNRELEKLTSAREVQNAFGLDVNALLPIIETLKQFESTGNIVSRLQGRQALSGAGGLGLSALKGVDITEVVTGGGGGGSGFIIKSNFISTDQSKVVLNALRNTLLDQIGDENIVAQILSETSKSVLPSSISQRGGKDLISVSGLLSGVDKVIKQIEESRLKDLELLKPDREDALGLLDQDQERAVVISKNLIRASGNIENLAKDLGEAFNFDQTNTRIKELNKEIEVLGQTINKINNGNPRGFSSGGLVGGAGNRDSISARLTPGEFVLNRKAVEKIGISNLNRLNRSNSRSTTQSSSTNAVSNTNSMEIAQESLAQLNRAMQTFAFNVQKLEKAFSSFPTEITITGRHFVEVVINGAQVLQNIKPEISSMIESEIKSSINKMLRTKFPDKGQVI